jgi:NADH:ubiquinone reductase (H+-translocating)
MPEEFRVWARMGVIVAALTALYWFASGDPLGTAMLIAFVVGVALPAALVWGWLRRNPAAGAGRPWRWLLLAEEVGPTRPLAMDDAVFPSRTLAPLMLGLGVTVLALSLIYGPLLILIAVPPLVVAAAGWLGGVNQEHRGTLARDGARPGGPSPPAASAIGGGVIPSAGQEQASHEQQRHDPAEEHVGAPGAAVPGARREPGDDERDGSGDGVEQVQRVSEAPAQEGRDTGSGDESERDQRGQDRAVPASMRGPATTRAVRPEEHDQDDGRRGEDREGSVDVGHEAAEGTAPSYGDDAAAARISAPAASSAPSVPQPAPAPAATGPAAPATPPAASPPTPGTGGPSDVPVLAPTSRWARRVVIIGGGFAGLYAARGLRGSGAQVTVIDRRNFHLFQPLLYQVATGTLAPVEIAASLRGILRRARDVSVLLGEVVGIDAERRRVLLADGDPVPYDTLIVAAGAENSYFRNPEWEELAPGPKTVEDALEMRRRILLAFETAEREPDAEVQERWMTFVVVGGGPTGVELAGTLADIARRTLPGAFRRIRPEIARVILLEGGPRVLPAFHESLSEAATRRLARLGVEVHLDTMVQAIDAEGVTVTAGGASRRIWARTILWGAGVRPSPLGRALQASAGAELDRQGRVIVGPDLSIPAHPEIHVAGDMAHFQQDGVPVPGVAPVAIQQGQYLAKLIRARLRGREHRAFHYRDKGSLAFIGRGAGIAQIGRLRFEGWLGYFAWLFVHLAYLIGFQSRTIVLMRWLWLFITRRRASLLITYPTRQGSTVVTRPVGEEVPAPPASAGGPVAGAAPLVSATRQGGASSDGSR